MRELLAQPRYQVYRYVRLLAFALPLLGPLLILKWGDDSLERLQAKYAVAIEELKAATNGSPGFRVLDTPFLKELMASYRFPGLEWGVRQKAYEEAVRRGALDFGSPGDVVEQMRRWFPEYRQSGGKLVGEHYWYGPTIPEESIAFQLVWDCWPEGTTWAPNIDPWLDLRSLRHTGASYSGFSQCWDNKLSFSYRTDAVQRDRIGKATRSLVAKRIVRFLERTQCQTSGADDCFLLLLALTELQPNEGRLPGLLERMERLLASQNVPVRPHQRLALLRARISVAVLAAEAGQGQHLTIWRNRAINWLVVHAPGLADWLEDYLGIGAANLQLDQQVALAELTSSLHAVLQSDGFVFPACCAYDAMGRLVHPLAPLAGHERAPVVAQAVTTVAGRIAQQGCVPGIMRSNLPDRSPGHEILSMLRFEYSLARAGAGDETRCWDITPDQSVLTLHGAKAMADRLQPLAMQDGHPYAAHEARRVLLDLCSAGGSHGLRSAECEALAPLRQDRRPAEGVRFDHATVDGQAPIDRRFPANVADQIRRLLADAACRPNRIRLFGGEEAGPAVLVTDCRNAASAEDEEVVFPDFLTRPRYESHAYPLTLLVTGNRVVSVAIPDELGFLYETGRLVGVSDMDGDGRLELWFEGSVAECDTDDAECESEGVVMGELLGPVVSFYVDNRRAPVWK